MSYVLSLITINLIRTMISNMEAPGGITSSYTPPRFPNILPVVLACITRQFARVMVGEEVIKVAALGHNPDLGASSIARDPVEDFEEDLRANIVVSSRWLHLANGLSCPMTKNTICSKTCISTLAAYDLAYSLWRNGPHAMGRAFIVDMVALIICCGHRGSG